MKVPAQAQRGLTILQTMLVLFVLGIIGWLALDYVIDWRCQQGSTHAMCVDRVAIDPAPPTAPADPAPPVR